MKKFFCNLKKFIKNKKKELSVIILFEAIFGFLQVILSNRDNRVLSDLAFLGIVFTTCLFFITLVKLLKKRLKDTLANTIKKGFSKFFKYLKHSAKKVAKKLGLQYDGSLIKGKDKIEFAFKEIRKTNQNEKKKKKKLPKWSELSNNKERVRYIYTAFLNRMRKSGYVVNPTKTPLNISNQYAKNKEHRRIFECYTDIRYKDEQEVVSDDIIKELLQILNKD